MKAAFKTDLTGTMSLVATALRRDRVFLLVWIGCVAAILVGMAPLMEHLVFAKEDPSSFVPLLDNPALRALSGPVYGAENYTVALVYLGKMYLYGSLAAGIFGMLLMARLTRLEEEQGRLELVRSLPVGRYAPLAAAGITSLLVHIILALLIALGLGMVRTPGMTWSGCLLFGGSIASVGLAYSAVTALFAQVVSSYRSVIGAGIVWIFAGFLLRAAGDAILSYEWLAWLSPIGSVLRTECFVRNLWFPVLRILGEAGIAFALAFALTARRDLGEGYLAERGGRKEGSASLSSPIGLLWRLQRGMIVGWICGMCLLGAMYGLIFNELERFIERNAMIQAMLAMTGANTFSDQYVSLLLGILALFVTLPCLMLVARFAGEERRGLLDHILAGSVSRNEALISYLVPVLLFSVLLSGASMTGLWAGSLASIGSPLDLPTLLLAFFRYLPAVWVLIALMLLAVASRKSRTGFVYAYFALCFVFAYLETMNNFPRWLVELTPYGHIPKYPIEAWDLATTGILLAIASTLGVLGFLRFRTRNLI